MKDEIERIFGELLRNLPLDKKMYEKRTFRIKKLLGGVKNGHIL